MLDAESPGILLCHRDTKINLLKRKVGGIKYIVYTIRHSSCWELEFFFWCLSYFLIFGFWLLRSYGIWGLWNLVYCFPFPFLSPSLIPSPSFLHSFCSSLPFVSVLQSVHASFGMSISQFLLLPTLFVWSILWGSS